MAKPVSLSGDVYRALCAAGFADENTVRVVIDFKAGEGIRVHTERLADAKIINVIQTLDGVEVTREEADHG